MRPLDCHWKLPDGCFCCCCRPFPVSELDWPVSGSVGLFREMPRRIGPSNPNWSCSIDSTSYLTLLVLRPLAVGIQASKLPFLVGYWVRLCILGPLFQTPKACSSVETKLEPSPRWDLKSLSFVQHPPGYRFELCGGLIAVFEL